MNNIKTFNDVLRKRLIIEMITSPEMAPYSKGIIENYLKALSRTLHMTIIMGPKVHSWAKKYDKNKYDGVEGIIMWAESGAQLYAWDKFNAITIDIYTCKYFSINQAIKLTKKIFHPKKIVWKEIDQILIV